MYFIGKDGQQVELRILGYQFPSGVNSDLDENWLRIYLNVKSKVGHWQTVDSSLTTCEVKELIEWFTRLSQNKQAEHTEMYFMEPCLTFQLTENSNLFKTIKMIFNAELKPQSAIEGEDYFVNFQFSNQELATIARELNNELSKFLVR